jgi:16S rRNA (guanine527-N7)-methyltransferase
VVLQPSLAAEINQLWNRADYPLSDRQLDQLAQYLELLNKWNRVHSLTAIENPSDQVRRHILDGLAIWPSIAAKFGNNPSIRAADVGSGMGVPGIVLAIAMPSLYMDLIERQQKKSAFLRQAASRLGLSDRVKVIEGDVSAIQPNPEYDLITSRAFAALPLFLELTVGISGPSSVWAAMMGRQNAIKSEHILIKMNNKINRLVVKDIVSIETPGVEGARHLAWIGRQA